MSVIRIATRGSRLALAQSRGVAASIERALGVATEIAVVRTSGDRLKDVPLAKLGGKGLFIKEIEEALLAGEADVAVHSAKDLPARLEPRLVLAAFPRRADPRDALVSHPRGAKLAGLPAGARVGTGSTRRAAQLRARRPDLEVLPLRGNVNTRLERLEQGRFDALVLACSGLDRLALGDRIDERLDPELMLPAVGQGALAVQTRAGTALAGDLAALTDAATQRIVSAERAFLGGLGGDCTVPLAGFAELTDAGVRLRGLVAAPDGSRVVSGEGEGAEPERVGADLAASLLARGAREILSALRDEAGA